MSIEADSKGRHASPASIAIDSITFRAFLEGFIERFLKTLTQMEAFKMERSGGWYWYLTEEAKLLEKHKCGKWMHFFHDQGFAVNICEKAIAENVCYECKCTDMELTGAETGVICFYLNGDDIENHHKVIQFMLDNQLIQKTKTGRLYNISFKFDDQTRAGEYGSGFEGTIKLAQFVDLNTGEWRS